MHYDNDWFIIYIKNMRTIEYYRKKIRTIENEEQKIIEE